MPGKWKPQISRAIAKSRFFLFSLDDTENKRSKTTKTIAWVHKIKDKVTGGYVMGQSLVFLVLVTPKNQSDIKTKCINADALYGSNNFFKGVSTVYQKTQLISQICKNQNIRFRNTKQSVEKYFSRMSARRWKS